MKATYLLILTVWPMLVAAGVPSASCTYYGILNDSHGLPFMTGARITFKRSDVEVSKRDINRLIGPGVNFQLAVDMDSGTGERYEPYAMREGEEMQIVIEVDGAVQPILEPSTLTVPAPGTDIALKLTVGTDSDGDGLPDEWEQQMMAASGGAITNITQITPDGDFDGDGASNMDEYLAGTFAFLDYDCFAIEDLEKLDETRFLFRFLSVSGKSYGLEVTDSLSDTNQWTAGAFSLDSQQAADLTGFVGDGYYKTMYIDVAGDKAFMRLVVK